VLDGFVGGGVAGALGRDVGWDVGGVVGGVLVEAGGVLLGSGGASLVVVDPWPTCVVPACPPTPAVHAALVAMIASAPVTTTACLTAACILVPHLNATIDD
jgi:hypothetical protein